MPSCCFHEKIVKDNGGDVYVGKCCSQTLFQLSCVTFTVHCTFKKVNAAITGNIFTINNREYFSHLI